MKHILLIEDDLSLINGLSFAIQKQGYEITVIRTAAEAGVVWTNKRFDMVILDVSLPDGSGYDICKKIRRVSNQCHLDKDNIAVRILFTASKHFVYSLFFYIQKHST